MHLVLDLQACQSPESRRRGIGRFSLALAKAIAAQPRGHEITVLLNTAMGGAIEDLRAQFADLIPQSNIRIWSSIAPTARMYADNLFRQRASETLRLEVLRKLKPDLVHIASLIEGMGDDVVATIPERAAYPTAVTLYDLIPLAHAKTYLASPAVREWYMEKIGFLRRSEMLLGISNFACLEAHELLGMAAERVVNISGAADSIFRPLSAPESLRSELRARYGLQKPYIMYAGGFDPRKNIAGLIRAFAQLPPELRDAHQLAIVGGVPEPERQQLIAQMAAAGVRAAEVVFTGYVSDPDLVKLYNVCQLYVFPSVQEGFGLPALEAMSCGAIVIGSNTSSLPEVIGRADALFDPGNDQSISQKMAQALTDTEFRISLREHARVQPKTFSWQESARRALDAFENTVELHKRVGDASDLRKTKVRRAAFLPAPAPNATSRPRGATVFADPDCRGVFAAKQRSLEWFRLKRERFERVIVELADDPYCAKTLALAAEGEADLILRERGIGKALAQLACDSPVLLAEALYRSGGYPALRAAIDGSFSADVLGSLVTPQGLAELNGCQVVEHTSGAENHRAISWRDFTGRVLAELGRIEGSRTAPEQDWQTIANAISRDLLQGNCSTQWLVDISNLCVRDAGTGIQRVVRCVLDQLIANPPANCRIEPVYLDDEGVFRYARGYCGKRYFPELTLPDDEPVEFGNDDVYLGLDLIAHKVPAFIDLFRDLRNRGVRQYYVVYDLLPLLRPDCFEPHLLPLFRAWYESVSEIADGLICISRSVADQFNQWLDQARPHRKRPLGIGYFHLGADFDEEPAKGGQSGLPDELAKAPTLLMVGTIEPRKGHAQVLRAFESLWTKGVQINLLIVGRPGWLSDDIIQLLRSHPELGGRLWWFEDADDALLRAAYRDASTLLMASEGEGYGLPLIEAAHHKLPLIARDLPVFREVAGEHAFYFSGFEPDDLAGAIESWLKLDAQGRSPGSEGVKRLTWDEARGQLVEVIREQKWVHTWSPGCVRRHSASDYRLQSDVGRLVRGRLHTTGQGGFLVHGPSLPLPAGFYRVRIRGGWNEAAGSAWAGIATGSPATPVTRKSLLPRVTDLPETLAELELQLAKDVSDYQVRVFVSSEASLWIEEIVIEACSDGMRDNAPPTSSGLLAASGGPAALACG